MTYHVEFTKQALKELKGLDKQTSALILGWIRKNLEGCIAPCTHGKSLTANQKGEWRYRVGDYRMSVEIQDGRIVILTLSGRVSQRGLSVNINRMQ